MEPFGSRLWDRRAEAEGSGDLGGPLGAPPRTPRLTNAGTFNS